MLVLIAKRAVQGVVEDIAEREQTDELAALIDHDQAVDSRFADCIEDGVEAVVERACVDTGEVLR